LRPQNDARQTWQAGLLFCRLSTESIQDEAEDHAMKCNGRKKVQRIVKHFGFLEVLRLPMVDVTLALWQVRKGNCGKNY
jgi:hypothetical protein